MRPKTSLWFESALLGTGWADGVRICMDRGRISTVEAAVKAGPEDERHAVAVPGLPNVHSHAFQRAMAGLTEAAGVGEDSFWSWRELMYRFLERLGPDDVEAISAFAFMEMLETGFTHVGEFHYLHHDPKGQSYSDVAELTHRIVAAAQRSGIGLTLLPVLYAHANFGGLAPTPAQRRFINDLEGFGRLVDSGRRAAQALEGAIVGIAPHSLRAVTPQELLQAISLAPSGPIHIHAAEQNREVDDCIAWSGQRPVEWLLGNTPVDARWSLIHATHLTSDEILRLAASRAVAGLCPVTESNLGDGIFPARDYLASGGVFGVGTDSNILIDPAAELRTLEYSQRLAYRRRNVLAGGENRSTGRRLYVSALKGGARSLGMTGNGLAAGEVADIVSLHAGNIALSSRREDALLDGWIFASRDQAVDCVWRYGRKVVTDGMHVEHDAIVDRYRNALGRLLA